MEEPTPRQVLYALVAGGFVVVVAILAVGGAVAGLVPSWWSVMLAVGLIGVSVWGSLHWRRTGLLLSLAIGLFVVWMVGTLMLAG
jgi:hypothetical protein